MSNNSKLNRKYGWLPELPGNRFSLLKPELFAEASLPTEIDLRSQFPDCYDQGQLGSCTANAIAGLIHHRMIVSNYKWQFTPSRLFIYYNERAIEGTVLSDAGAAISDGVNSINSMGVCPEIEGNGTNPDWLWTYDDNTNDSLIPPHLAKFKQKPPEQCYKDAVLHKSLTANNINLDRLTVLNTLAAGRPVVFGFTVYSSFESDETMNTGIMSVPNTESEQVLGGHAIDAVGYALNKPMGSQGVVDWALIRNSWGTSVYGDLKGYFWMPLDQVMCSANISSDAHTIDVMLGENQHA